VALLQQEAGKALDPTVVRCSSSCSRRCRPRPPDSRSRATRAEEDARAAIGQPATGLAPGGGPKKKNVFDDIALAHREIYALYEIAQAMGTSLGVADTMALISAKLSNLVPFSCAALFLYDEEAERCAAGSPPASTPS
jgi:hypothetical protein